MLNFDGDGDADTNAEIKFEQSIMSRREISCKNHCRLTVLFSSVIQCSRLDPKYWLDVIAYSDRA